MYQSTSSSFEELDDNEYDKGYNDDDYFLPPDKFETDGEYVKNGYTPIGCYMKDGRYLILDFCGNFPLCGDLMKYGLKEGLYLYNGREMFYWSGEYVEKPDRIIYSWD